MSITYFYELTQSIKTATELCVPPDLDNVNCEIALFIVILDMNGNTLRLQLEISPFLWL